jgi:hypothetical protein
MSTGQIIKVALISIGVPIFFGFGIGSNTPMPAHAPVFIDDATQSYLAAPCRNIAAFNTEIRVSELRLGTKSEARRKNYKPDRVCRNTGLHAPEGRSLSGFFFEWLGLLPPLQYWWDNW